MLVRFTPKQLVKIKEMLKTCTLKAYDIQIYQEILNNLENAIDEKKNNNIETGYITRSLKSREINNTTQHGSSNITQYDEFILEDDSTKTQVATKTLENQKSSNVESIPKTPTIARTLEDHQQSSDGPKIARSVKRLNSSDE